MTKYTKVQARTKVMKKLTLLSQAILPSTKLYNGWYIYPNWDMELLYKNGLEIQC